ncbi:MAG: amino acid racemase [Patescibacteria group bacterium]
MKKLGIIGGLGPETTANFYKEVILSCSNLGIKHRPSILIANVPIDFELEKKFINHSQGKKEFLKLLTDAAISLEKGGADFIVIPCNTAHVFINEVRKVVRISVLSIIEETTKFLQEKKVNNIGILATPSTVKNKLFDVKLKTCKIKAEFPKKEKQILLGKIINKILRSKHGSKEKKELLGIIDEFSCDSVLLACTDLHILLQGKSNTKIFDTMQILRQAAVRELLA